MRERMLKSFPQNIFLGVYFIFIYLLSLFLSLFLDKFNIFTLSQGFVWLCLRDRPVFREVVCILDSMFKYLEVYDLYKISCEGPSCHPRVTRNLVVTNSAPTWSHTVTWSVTAFCVFTVGN